MRALAPIREDYGRLSWVAVSGKEFQNDCVDAIVLVARKQPHVSK